MEKRRQYQGGRGIKGVRKGSLAEGAERGKRRDRWEREGRGERVRERKGSSCDSMTGSLTL